MAVEIKPSWIWRRINGKEAKGMRRKETEGAEERDGR